MQVVWPCGGGTASQSLAVRSSDTPFMPAPTDSQHEWLWQSLGAGQYQVVSSLAPFDFDWKSLHPIYGTPLMAMLHHAILFPGGKEEEQRVHDMARYCMRQGADPRIVAPRATGLSVGLPPAPPGPNWLAYDDAGHCWWQYDGPLGIFWCEDCPCLRKEGFSLNFASAAPKPWWDFMRGPRSGEPSQSKTVMPRCCKPAAEKDSQLLDT